MLSASIIERNFAVAVRSLQTLDMRAIQASARGLSRGLLHTVEVIQREFLSGPPRPARRPKKTPLASPLKRGARAPARGERASAHRTWASPGPTAP